MLNDRERRIFEARRLADEPIILAELADEFGISRERVRQIEVRAFEKMQKAGGARDIAVPLGLDRHPRFVKDTFQDCKRLRIESHVAKLRHLVLLARLDMPSLGFATNNTSVAWNQYVTQML